MVLNDSWHGNDQGEQGEGEGRPPAASLEAGDSGMLTVDITQITTGRLLPVERWQRVQGARMRRVTDHERLAGQYEQVLCDLQRSLFELAEQIGEMSTRWQLLHANMEPTLDVISQMRDIDRQLSGKVGHMNHLRATYLSVYDDMQRHLHAAENVRKAVTSRPL